jgi:hypothetical protein
VIALGSSRVAMGLRAEATAHRPDAPLLFNFGLIGGGPIMELVCLRRLLADGIRPDLVLVEVWPPFWVHRGPLREVNRIELDRLTVADMRLVRRFIPDARNVTWCWWQAQLTPWFSNRFKLMNLVAPAWLPFTARKDHNWKPLDPWGWLPGQDTRDGVELYPQRFQKVQACFGPILHDYAVDERARLALRDLLELCRSEGLRVALLYMPEGDDFRQLYSPVARKRSDKVLAELRKEHPVPVIDARSWMANDDFLDGFHLLTAGAYRFTDRLERDGIRPLLQGKAAP